VKKIFSLIISLYCLSLFSSLAQGDTEYYKKVIDTTSDVALKLASMDSLLTIQWRQNNFVEFVDYSVSYIDLAEKVGRYEDMTKKAMNVSFPLINNLSNPQKSIDLLNRVVAYEKNLTDSFLRGGIYLKRGGAYFNINTQKAIDDYSRAIEIYEEKDAIYKADAFLFRGQAHSALGQFVAASEDYKAAYDLFEKEEDYEYMLHARSGEIVMYSKNGFLEKSLRQRASLISNLLDLKLFQYLSTQHYNQSLDYKKLHKHDLRYENLQDALKYADSALNPPFVYTATYSALSDYFSLINKPEEALHYLEKAKENLSEIPNDKYANSIYLMALIHYQKENGQWIEAKENSLKRLELVESIGLDEENINTHKTLSEIYSSLNDNERAFYHLEKHSKLKDSLYNQSNTNALIYYQTLYETERKEKELNEKRSSIAILEEKNTSIKRQYLFGGVALTFGFLLLFLYKNQQSLKSKKALQEKYTQDLLLAQEEERKRVSKDLHDGIGQSLLLIKNKVVLNKNDSTKKLIENAIEEVRSISRALHPFQLQELGITKAIENIFYQIDESSELFITTEIENIDGIFSIEKEVNLYRIVQESMNNVLKHSKASAVKVEITNTEKNVQLRIRDNGVGFDFSERKNDFNSLGLKTLKERTRFLQGVMKIDSETSGKGTTITFIIPKK